MQVAANDQVPVNPLAMTDGEVSSSLIQMAKAITTQDQAITAQAKWEIVPRENQHTGTMASRLRDFTSMKPPKFFGSNELGAYILKDLAQTWYNQWKDSRPLRGSPVTWEIFKNAIIGRFLPREQRESKVEEFIKILQGGMSVKQYSLMFI